MALEKDLVKSLKITWAEARELLVHAKESLGQQSKYDDDALIGMATQEYERRPKKPKAPAKSLSKRTPPSKKEEPKPKKENFLTRALDKVVQSPFEHKNRRYELLAKAKATTGPNLSKEGMRLHSALESTDFTIAFGSGKFFGLSSVKSPDLEVVYVVDMTEPNKIDVWPMEEYESRGKANSNYVKEKVRKSKLAAALKTEFGSERKVKFV